jgi:hypothetical protein
MLLQYLIFLILLNNIKGEQNILLKKCIGNKWMSEIFRHSNQGTLQKDLSCREYSWKD